MQRGIAVVTAVALSLTSAIVTSAGAQEGPVEPYRTDDTAVTALNILPPGQGRHLNAAEMARYRATGEQPEHNTDQIEMYDSLVQAAPGITAADLTKYFKDASFGVKSDDVARTYEPRPGTVVVRDKSFGVPHVYGKTRDDVMFGAGYVSAEDRLFMMDVLRHVGRGRMSEFLGASEANLASDRAVYRSTGYTEEELERMLARLGTLHGELGATAVKDVDAFAAGVNAYIDEARTDPSKLPAEYEALQQFPRDWQRTDTVAIASLIGSALGVGGGDELRNAAFLDALEKGGYRPRAARRILKDFRFANDPEATTTTNKPFPWPRVGRVDRRSVARPDDALKLEDTLDAARFPGHVDGPFGRIPLAFPDSASNALLIGRKLSASGRPLAVYGPQVGYWSPEILMEMDLHGPGIESRGVGFPGISLYTLLGRGSGYAWSATSAGGDQVDIFAEKLCDPEGEKPTTDSDHYVKAGKCTEMYTRTDTWVAKPSAGGTPVPPGEDSVVVRMTTQRTDDGIVQARGTVKRRPVAFVAKRSTFKKEVDSAATYVEISDPARIDGARDFQRAFGRFGFTFNWFYLDDRDIAFQLGGYHPLRTRHTDPDLPVWGRGRWRWRGMLSFEDTPKDISPRKGYITSWNNKQAPRFRANDGQFSFGPVHRVDPLDAGIKRYKRKNGKLTLVDVVNIMGSAGTVDLRGFRVLKYMLRGVGSPKDDTLRRATQILDQWRRRGAHRRDRNKDGSYEHSAAIALMDEWWPRAARAIFEPRLRNAYEHLPVGLDNAPGPVGSAYQNGLYGHVQKDLRTVLGLRVRGRYSRVYCGKGSLRRCRRVLRTSLRESVAALQQRFGADPGKWDADEAGDMIRFTSVGLTGQRPMQWQNRPTFQQVLEFGGGAS